MKRIFILLLLSFGLAQGQTWTIQIASFYDFRLAQRSLDRLVSAGFDSYSEFFMEEGSQFVRVRVGCFESREAAQNFLDTMNSMGQINAYITQNTNSSNNCINRSVGFITPEKWGTYRLNNDNIVFWVNISGLTAFISNSASGWQISQTGTDLLIDTIQERPIFHYFVQNNETGPIYVVIPNRKPYKLTTGKLLWQSGILAVILENDTMVSYRLSLRSD